MYRLILDAYCSRVMYFTSDPKVKLHLNDHVTMREWFELLPDSMTLGNCWDWKIMGDKLVHDPGTNKTITKTLFEENKDNVTKLLINKVNSSRQSIQSKFIESDYSRGRKILEASNNGGEFLSEIAKMTGKTVSVLCQEIIAKHTEYERIMTISEIWKDYYKHRLSIAKTNDELYSIRDEIANKDFTSQ